jgi:hypothetical protein
MITIISLNIYSHLKHFAELNRLVIGLNFDKLKTVAHENALESFAVQRLLGNKPRFFNNVICLVVLLIMAGMSRDTTRLPVKWHSTTIKSEQCTVLMTRLSRAGNWLLHHWLFITGRQLVVTSILNLLVDRIVSVHRIFSLLLCFFSNLE